MKIKIKIKTLILIVFVFMLSFIWAIPTVILSIAILLDDYGSDNATFFYEKYASYPTTSDVNGGFLYAQSLVKSFNKYTIFDNGWGGGENTRPEDMEKSIIILEGIMKETHLKTSEKQYYFDSYKMLLDIAIATGDIEMLSNWISFGQSQEIDDEMLTYISDIYNGFILHVNGDRDGAKKIIAKYELSDLADANLDILKAEIFLFEENYEEAKKIYEDISRYKWKELEKGNFGSTGYYNRDYWIDEDMKGLKGDNILRGTVTYEEEPMPFVEVYVKEADGGFRIGGESYIGITDENGKFETLGLKDGVYDVGIGVEGSLLANMVLQRSNERYFELNGDNKEIKFEFKDTMDLNIPKSDEIVSGDDFTVSWEEVDKADYYIVDIISFSDPYKKSGDSGGAIFRSPVDKNGQIKFTETQVTFNIDLLRGNIVGISKGEEGLLSPEAVLGLFLPEVKYPIVVNAYDENNRLITSSLPLRTYYDQIPSITVEGRLTEGEKLILSQNYLEAIEYYENVLKESPDNIDALRYLVKIYGIGWKDGERKLERAIELGQKYTDVSNSNGLLISIILQMEINEIKKNSELYYSAIELTEVNDDSYYYYLSRYYIAFENWEEARNALQNTEGYVPVELFYLNMYLENYGEAAENTKYLYSSNLKSIEVKEALGNLEDNPPQSNDKQIFDDFLLKLVIGIQREEGKALYDEIIKHISNNNLKTILREIYLERDWDINY